MDETLARLLAVIYAVLIPSAAAFGAYWLTLRARRQQARDQDGVIADLQQQLESLQAESRGQFAELNERLDFAERLLAQQRVPPAVKPPDETST